MLMFKKLPAQTKQNKTETDLLIQRMCEKGDREQEVLTSSHKINKSQGCNIQHR